MDQLDQYHLNAARALFGITTVCCILGIFLNIIIFISTLKTRSLRATYNILIAVCAVADVFHLIGNLVLLPFLIDIHLSISSALCDAIIFLPEMGIGTGCMCILCVGVDRTVSVLFTTRYRVMNKRNYHIILALPIIGYCVYICALMIVFYRPRQVLCDIVSPYLEDGIPWFTGSNLIVNAISTIVYFILWLGLRSHGDSKAMKRIIKSLFIIVTVDVSGWFLTPALVNMGQLLDLNGQQQLLWKFFSIIFINLALCVKFFIYYATSSEYRSAIRSLIFGKRQSQISEISRTRFF